MQQKICKECGQPFYTQYSRKSYCDRDHYRPCPVCQKPVLVKPGCFNDPPRCCSKTCQITLTKQRNMEKYGTEDPGNSASALEKRKQTNLDRYGCVDAGNRPEAREKRKQTNLQRYGVENAGASKYSKEKRKETNLKLYGVENAMQNTDIQQRSVQGVLDKYGVLNVMQSAEVQERAKQTNLKKYGVPWAVAAPEVRAKSDQTKLLRFGTIYPTQLEEIQRKTQQTTLHRYGVTHYSKTEAFKAAYKHTVEVRYGVSNVRNIPGVNDKIKQTNLERYGAEYAFLTEESIQKSYEAAQDLKRTHISKCNRAFGDMLAAANIPFKFEYPLEKKRFDFILENRNIVIEIDPTYTHSTEPSVYYPEGNLDKYYHRNKTLLAEKHGFRCIHIFDWDDAASIINMLAEKSSIYARKCEVCFISESAASEFLDHYHLQKSVRGQVICLGLVYNDELVSVMTFGQPRYTNKYQLELLRYATAADLRIVGGASKLFRFCLNEVDPESIISYCNRAKFTGDIYTKLGFKLVRHNPPAKVWSKDSEIVTDILLHQRGYDQLFNTNYGKGTNNEELMRQNGWRSVYDCGQDVYVYMKPDQYR